MKYPLINDSSITNLRQSLLCLDLDHITESDNCATAMESLAPAVGNTYKLCCPMKSETLSNKNLKKLCITGELISNIRKRQHYLALYRQNKIPKDFYIHFRYFVTGQIRQSNDDYYEHKFNAAKIDIKQT